MPHVLCWESLSHKLVWLGYKDLFPDPQFGATFQFKPAPEVLVRLAEMFTLISPERNFSIIPARFPCFPFYKIVVPKRIH